MYYEKAYKINNKHKPSFPFLENYFSRIIFVLFIAYKSDPTRDQSALHF